MKQLITAAALLGIGAAASFGAEVSFELVGNNNNVSGTDITGGRATFSSITVDGVTLSSGEILDGSMYSWAISFSTEITDASNWNDTNVIFSTSGGTNGSGPGILATQSNGSISYYLVDEVYTEESGHAASGSALTVASNTEITLSWDAENYTLTLSSTGVDSLVLNETSAVSLTVGVEGGDTGGIANSAPSGSVFWTNSGHNNISGITLTAEKTVPEPSMFGLLAGLGAIGLVAARRRRNRKA